MKTLLLVGFGDRGHVYAAEAEKHPDKVRIAAIVEPDDFRRNEAKERFGIAEENCFTSVEACAAKGKIADAVINTTMDRLHIGTSLPLIALGYDMLLEKPVTNNKEELLQLEKSAAEHGCKLMVCHVLRYTPFYRAIKEVVLSGEIGRIVDIQTNEFVALCHASHSYIRGKWNNREKCGSSMLLAKCCHDIDLICWLNNTAAPARVTSMGGRYFFVEKNAPKNAGTRCLVDCPVEKDCIYSARKLSLEHDFFPWLAWDCFKKDPSAVTTEEKEASLKADNVHGRCIFKTDADVVDRQTVSIRFSDGSLATHGMIAGVAKAGRDIHIVGTLGEVQGFLEENKFVVRTYDPETLFHKERTVDLSQNVGGEDRHSGGDSRLIEDFIRLLHGEPLSVSSTVIQDSVYGHLTVFAADESLEKDGEPVDIVFEDGGKRK